MIFKYKDCTQKIPQWPYWGAEICLIFFADSITEADKLFKQKHPEFVNKNNLTSGIVVSIIKP